MCKARKIMRFQKSCCLALGMYVYIHACVCTWVCIHYILFLYFLSRTRKNRSFYECAIVMHNIIEMYGLNYAYNLYFLYVFFHCIIFADESIEVKTPVFAEGGVNLDKCDYEYLFHPCIYF